MTTAAELSIIPLGGLGEVGLNSMVIEYGPELLLIDAGLMFPEDESMPGVDIIIPDFSYLFNNAGRIKGLLLTHGHEDHIGALGHLCRRLDSLAIYGTRLTLALARERLKEHHLDDVSLVEIAPREKIRLGSFEIEFIQVNHSILDGVALGIATPAGVIVHSGDFKIDQSPTTGDRIDLYKFAEYGERGVLAFLSDSTNAEIPGHTESEVVVGQALRRIFMESPGRVILACFASSLARIKQVVLAASQAGRRVAFDGRSMINIAGLAKKMGLLDIPEDLELPLSDLMNADDREVVVVATGSQGEPMSALARMAYGEHKHLIIKPEDTIILSARSIPGNERAITQLIDRFYRLGARVIHGRESQVHTSGHAQAEELKTILNLVRPKYLVPIHGETRHLMAHAALARDLGWLESETLVLENGQRLILSPGPARIAGEVVTGRWLVDGKSLGTASDPVLRERLILAEGGLVLAAAAFSSDGDELLAPLRLTITGVHYENEFDLTLEAANVAQTAIDEWQSIRFCGPWPLAPPDTELLEAFIRKALKKLFRENLGRRPRIITQLIFAKP